MTEQVIRIEPANDLIFKGPFTQVVTSNLVLTNPTAKKVCFKVKTTAPKRYCVKPNSGILDPGSSVTIAVNLQPFTYDAQERNRHKFLVQTMYALEDFGDKLEAMWSSVSPDQLMDSKLKCIFELPNEGVNMIDQPSKFMSTRSEATVGKPDEIHSLREENKRLKESELRLRKLAMSESRNDAPLSMVASMDNNARFPPMIYLIVAFILGLILGKMFL